MFISRCGIDRQNGVEYVELSFKSNGNTKHRIVDRITISSVSELIKETQYGAPVNSGNVLHIVNFLAAWISVNKEIFDSFEVVNQLGWFKNPMAWGTYMLRKSFVSVIIRFRVKARPMAWGAYMLRISFVSVFVHLRMMARENPFRFEMMHRTREKPTTVNRVRQPAAKVKKEPDTEILISPALKEKILRKEGVDLKHINNEYQEEKGNNKGNGKQQTKIINQEPGAASDIDEDEIIDVNIYNQLTREWNKFRWYSIPSIAKKMGKHRKTVVYWRDFGIKVNGSNIRLKMAKRPFHWYSKGKWIIEFFLKTNDNVEME